MKTSIRVFICMIEANVFLCFTIKLEDDMISLGHNFQRLVNHYDIGDNAQIKVNKTYLTSQGRDMHV